jgi:hypothetical protein
VLGKDRAVVWWLCARVCVFLCASD